MPAARPSSMKPHSEYRILRRNIEEVLIQSRREMEALKVRMYWKTGQLIGQYIKEHPEEAEHGKGVIERLSADLKVERTMLYRVLRFAEAFPNVATWQHLNWSHYRELLTLEDSRKRQLLAQAAEKRQWPVRRLVREIYKVRGRRAAAKSKGPQLAEPPRPELPVRRVVLLPAVQGEPALCVDLGFQNYVPLQERLRRGDAVRYSETKKRWEKGGTPDDLYFYRGQVERVVDGDTFRVQVDLTFGWVTRQYLRLRGADADPLDTPRGRRARDFALKFIGNAPFLLFKSRWRDPYDRYLSDIWLPGGGKAMIYLNQLMRDKGLLSPV